MKRDNILNIIFVAAVVTIAFFIVRIGYVESITVTELKARSDSLRDAISYKEVLISAEKLKKDFFMVKSDSLEQENGRLIARIKGTEARLRDVEVRVGELPTDTIYSLLDAVLYPDDGDKVFPFSDNQIRGILVTKIEHDTLEILVSHLDSRITNQESQLTTKDLIIASSDSIIATQESVICDFKNVVANDSTIIDILETEIKKDNRRLRFWQATTGVAVIAVLIVL